MYVITMLSRQDQMRAMTSHKPFLRPAGLRASGRVDASDCTAGTNLCFGPLLLAATWGTWAPLGTFVSSS